MPSADTIQPGRVKRSPIHDLIPEINPDTKWDEWNNNWVNNVAYYAEADDNLRKKWTFETVKDFYNHNINRFTSLIENREYEKIVSPSQHYPYTKNNLEKLLPILNRKKDESFEKAAQKLQILVDGIRTLKRGVLRRTGFCRKPSSYDHPYEKITLEPLLNKVFRPHVQHPFVTSKKCG